MGIDLPKQVSFSASCRPLLAAPQTPAWLLEHVHMQILPTALQACSVKTSMCADVSFKCLQKGNTGKADALQSWHMQLS